MASHDTCTCKIALNRWPRSGDPYSLSTTGKTKSPPMRQLSTIEGSEGSVAGVAGNARTNLQIDLWVNIWSDEGGEVGGEVKRIKFKGVKDEGT